nr:replicative helicase loader/inhibitor [Paenibacillus sp. F411]
MIKTAYPFFEITEPGVRLWQAMLQDLDYKTAQERLRQHIRTSRFAPAIADIVNQSTSEPSYYELQRAEEEADRMALAEYNDHAVPMPDHIREKRDRMLQKKKVGGQ